MNEATAHFIQCHAEEDVRQLALRGTKVADVDLLFALDQIAGRQTARHKLPTWAETEAIVFPPHLALEQCSSETTARYKAQLIAEKMTTQGLWTTTAAEDPAPRTSLLDLTGGFGVDFSFLAPLFNEAVYVERQSELYDIARHNILQLGLKNAETVCTDSSDYLHQTTRHFTLIYIDPARRDIHGARTYAISDCTPDVLSLRAGLTAKADMVLLKLSPMLDWRKAVSDLGEQWVREVHIVSVNNECKELLLLLYQGEGQRVVCVNDKQCFECSGANVLSSRLLTGREEVPKPLTPPRFLYEPNSSIMKAGCFNEVEARFGISQIAPNSHLFLADRPVTEFPGRAFEVIAVTTMNKRELKETLHDIDKANITVRNFPMTVVELRRRLKISEGGNTYIFATTLASGDRRLYVCHKVI